MSARIWMDHAECRLETGHRWLTTRDLGIIGADWTKLQVCTKCHTTRKRGWNVWTGKLTSRYRYPPGYLFGPGEHISLAKQRVAYSKQALRLHSRKAS